MSFADTLRTLFEIGLVAFTLWAIFHEDRFIEFEDRICAYVRRRRFKVIEGNSVRSSHSPKVITNVHF